MGKYIYLCLALSLLLRWPLDVNPPFVSYKFELPSRHKVDLNRDNSLWLQTLKNVGPKRALNIIKNRPYINWSDVVAVKGISQKLLESWQPELAPLLP